MGFARQEYWNGLPFPPPENPPDPGIKLKSSGAPALAGRFFVTQPKYWAYYDHLLSNIELLIKHIHLFGFRVSPESVYSWNHWCLLDAWFSCNSKRPVYWSFNLQIFKDALKCRFQQHQMWVKLQLALCFLLPTILQLYHLPPPLPPPVGNSSCLFTWCQPLYASCCTVLLYFSKIQYCKTKNMFLIFFKCIICVKSIINLLQHSTK